MADKVLGVQDQQGNLQSVQMKYVTHPEETQQGERERESAGVGDTLYCICVHSPRQLSRYVSLPSALTPYSICHSRPHTQLETDAILTSPAGSLPLICK